MVLWTFVWILLSPPCSWLVSPSGALAVFLIFRFDGEGLHCRELRRRSWHLGSWCWDSHQLLLQLNELLLGLFSFTRFFQINFGLLTLLCNFLDIVTEVSLRENLLFILHRLSNNVERLWTFIILESVSFGLRDDHLANRPNKFSQLIFLLQNPILSRYFF